MAKAKHSHQWSLAGAARAAREARIASAKFMSTPAMAQWHMWGLDCSLGLYALHDGGDPLLGLAGLSRSLGYFLPRPDLSLLSELILQDETRYLSEATLYVLSPHMADVVTAAAMTLTLKDLQLMHEENLPAPTGLVVLPHPLITRLLDGDLADPRGFLWHHPARIRPSSVSNVRQRSSGAVHVAVYNDGHGPLRPESWMDFCAWAAAQGTPVPPLILDANRSFPYRHQFTDTEVGGLDRFSSEARQLGRQARQFAAELGLDEERVVGEYTPGQEIANDDDLFGVKFLFAFWRLAEQHISVPERAPVNHSAQATANRAGIPADVRVVRLRRTDEHRATEESTDAVNWKHRWPVRMHKVWQWYPSRSTHEVLWRGPYVKGPADKPLIGGETVWGLVR